MANYLKINTSNKLGYAYVSKNIVSKIVAEAISKFDSVAIEHKKKRKSSFEITNDIFVNFIGNNAYIDIYIDVYKGYNIEEVCVGIQESVATNLNAFLEQASFKIKTIVGHII